VDKIKFLDLGKQPIANGFLDSTEDFENEFFYNLSVGYDADTGLITQMDYVDKERMFNDSYAYRGSMSKTMRKHFERLSESLKTDLDSDPKVLEIGSNDGVFLKNWCQHSTFAVEPCGNFAEETNNMGYKTYPEFWNMETSNKILEEQYAMDLVFAANCMCHIPDLDEAFSAVNNILAPDGLFVFEDPSLVNMITMNSYDQIYDEHPHIFSVIALENILNRNNMSIVYVEHVNVHGGSNRIYAKKGLNNEQHKSVAANIHLETNMGLDSVAIFHEFAYNVSQSKQELLAMLDKFKNKNKKVISYGATSKSTTVFNYCGIGPNLIEYITDTTPEKQGRYSPGTHIPIIDPEQGFDDTIDFAFLGAWNFAEEIKNKEKDFNGKFITHVPIVRTV
jgi:SAM-dependent methyltransferase